MKKYIFTVGFFLFVHLFAASFTTAEETELFGGFAKVDITPSKPVTLAGYADRKDLSTGIHDPLFARVAVFQSGENRIVLVSTDIIDFYNGTDIIIRQAILDAFDLEPKELFLTAIHTHAAPTTVLDKEHGHPHNIAYTKTLRTKLISVIGEALENLRPIRVGVRKGSSPVGVNRREIYYDEVGNPRMWIGRNPNGIQDKEVSVLKITDTKDVLISVLWEYATHSTSLGWQNLEISGDIHGLAEQFIERYFGNDIIAPGFAGASGDIDPWYRVLPGFETNNGWIPEPVLMGTMLGQEIVHVLRDIDETSPLGPVRSLFETIELPGKPSYALETTEDEPPVPLNITVARVGHVVFVGLGAEVLSEIGLAIKASSPFKQTIILTHCNGTADYISPQHIYLEGGYEVESSPFASTAAGLLVKHVTRLLHQL